MAPLANASFALVNDDTVVAQHDAAILVPWWSFTKTAIAAAALALVRDNLVPLDDPLPGHAFTLRQLLSHQAGLVDYGQLPAYHEAVARGDDPWPDAEMLARTHAQKLIYPPGKGWNYSNIGYLYVRRLIENITEESLDDALQRLVFSQLGINGARLAVSPSDLIGVRMGGTAAYNPRWVYHGLLFGALHSAALFLSRLMTGELLPADLLEAMCNPCVLDRPSESGRPWASPGYGLGLMVATVGGGTRVCGHTGGGPGSVIAVYHAFALGMPTCSAVFSIEDDQGRVEGEAVRLMKVG